MFLQRSTPPDHEDRRADGSAEPFCYRLYGLTVQSQLVLPCHRTMSYGSPDVRVAEGTDAPFDRARAESDASSDPDRWFHCRRMPDGSTYLRWSGMCEFIVSADGGDILCRRLEGAPAESFNVYLLGQVLSFSLLALGFEPLHGTAVAIDDGAVVFLGDCGYGKSTLAAALLARGFPILTDDVVAIEKRDGTWTVHPGVPRIKLFPPVQRQLLGSGFTGPPMHSGTTKLVLPLGAEHTARRVVPLKALYVLSDPEQPVQAGCDPITIESLTGRDAFLEVTRAAFNLLVVEPRRNANQFAFAAQLSAGVPVRRLTYPRDLSALPAVCAAVVEDASSVGRQSEAKAD